MADMTAHIFAIAKKVGYSFDELNELTTQMFFDIIAAYAGGEENGGMREATQSEIDRFLL